MIGKVIITGKGFGETCDYLEREESLSEVLAVEGVRAHDPQLMAQDFEWQHRLMPDKENPVFHSVLSFPPGERIDNKRLVELGKEYLERVGIVNTQYAMVKHTDKEHWHVHVIANRVDNDGRPIAKGRVKYWSMKAAKELTEKYGLRPEQGKHLDRTHLDALRGPDARRYQLYGTIREVLPECRNLGELEERLRERGVEVRYRHDPETNERQGISFRLENRSFKGSSIDADFSFRHLEQTLQLQERQVQEKAQLRSLSEALESMVKGRPVGWDKQESLRRRQELKERLERSAEERQAAELAQQLRVRQEEKLAEEQALQHTQRRGLRL